MKKFTVHKRQVEETISDLQAMIEKLRAMEESFLKQQETLWVISEFANDWEYWQDEDGNYQYVSPSCENLTGYGPDEFYQNPGLLQKIIVPDDWQRWLEHSHTRAENGVVEPIEFEIRTKAGERKWIHHVCRTVKSSTGENIGIRGSNRDISDLKILQRKLEHVAGHDPLTGLANRSLLMEHLRQRLKEASRQQSMFVVAFIDLDDFKAINDDYGHDVGDQVLQRVAEDLKANIRQDDIIARFGGDEFVGIFRVTANDDANVLKEKILQTLSRKIACQRFNITVMLSIGMSVYPADSTDIDELLKIADQEMYTMKARNKARRNEKG
ncbi:MAG: sensor domain-containing diguanylate cyclase [Thermodesulfobacteriota bacterium]